ncbi:hypothetical protein ACTXT7_003168 [Hymenolepis weldensis]
MIGEYVAADSTGVPTVMLFDVGLGVNANEDAYEETLQTIVVKPPWTDNVLRGGRPYIFRQDSAPFHKAFKIRD